MAQKKSPVSGLRKVASAPSVNVYNFLFFAMKWEIWSGSNNRVYMYMYYIFHWLAKKGLKADLHVYDQKPETFFGPKRFFCCENFYFVSHLC